LLQLLPYQKKIFDSYNKVAPHYDQYISIYNWIWELVGFRYNSWRIQAINALNLNKGHVVVDLGCGTGLNFSHFFKSIGSSGKVIGVDISHKMLEMAKKRIEKNKWNNSFLFLSTMLDYEIPRSVDGIICTYSLGLSKSHDQIIQKSFHSLKPGGRLVVLEFKKENISLPAKLFLPFWLMSIKDYSNDTIGFGSVYSLKSMKKYFSNVQQHEFFGGLVYLNIGIK